MIDTFKSRNCAHQYNRLKDFCENNWEDIDSVIKHELEVVLTPRKGIGVRKYSKKVFAALQISSHYSHYYSFQNIHDETWDNLDGILNDLYSALMDYRNEMSQLTNEIVKEFHQ